MTHALEVHGFSKTFAGVRVLRDVDFVVEPGEIHGLLGQNGSGKSTLIKLLSGFYEPDFGGSLSVFGRDIALPVKAHDIRQAGMTFLHQDLGLVPTMSVLENLALGRGYQTGRGQRIRWRSERAYFADRLRTFGLDVKPDTMVGELPQAEQAIVGIIRALDQLSANGDTRGVIVLDEPTAQLPGHDVARLFEGIRAAVSSGASAVIVTHRLDEVQEITDRVTVLRDGAVSGTCTTAAADEAELTRLILGRDIGQLYPDAISPVDSDREVLLSAKDISGEQAHGITFDLHAGEILGLTGLVGMGQDEVPYLLFGGSPIASGSLTYKGEEVTGFKPRDAIRLGLGLLPANRQVHSSMQSATVRHNVTLPDLPTFFEKGRLQHGKERKRVKELLHKFDVRPPEPERVFSSLSGGNQQKALLAKWLRLGPSVLLLHEPTQGVDVGARQQLFQLVEEAAEAGTGIVLCSSEYEDLAHLCHRVLVMQHGSITAELTGENLTTDAISEQVYFG